MFEKFVSIDNILGGEWRIHQDTFDDNVVLIDIQNKSYVSTAKHKHRSIMHSRSMHFIRCIALYQSNVEKITNDDIATYSTPFKITSKHNIFFSLADKKITNIKIMQFYRKDDTQKEIVRVVIEEVDRVVNNISKDDVDANLDDISVGNSSDMEKLYSDHNCTCRINPVQLLDEKTKSIDGDEPIKIITKSKRK